MNVVLDITIRLITLPARRWRRFKQARCGLMYLPYVLVDHRTIETAEAYAHQLAQLQWRRRVAANRKTRAAQLKVNQELGLGNLYPDGSAAWKWAYRHIDKP